MSVPVPMSSVPASLQASQLRVLERIAEGSPLRDTLGAVCEFIEDREPGITCAILLTDAAGMHTGVAAGASLPDDFLLALLGINISPPHVGSCCRALDTGEDVLVTDIAHDLRWSAPWRELNLAQGFRACRSVPVKNAAGEVLASIAVFGREVGHPGPASPELIEAAASLIDIAIERERADTERRALADREHSLLLAAARSNAHFRLLLDSATVLLGTHDPNEMLQGLFDRIAEHLELDAFFHFMPDDSGLQLRLCAYHGVSEDEAAHYARLAVGQSLSGVVARSLAPVVLNHIQQSTNPQALPAKQLGFRCGVSMPLITDGRLLGTLSFGSRRKDELSSDDLAFLDTISRYVTSACERLRLVSKLQDSDRRKDEFLATLAHELRNPLAPLRNGLHMLQVARDKPGIADKALAMMDRQLKQMVRLVDDLLDVSRISSGKITLCHSVFNLATALEQAVETCQPLLLGLNHRLATHLAPEPLMVHGDMARVSQVIANLLNNAAKYTPAGGLLEVWLERDGDEAAIRVRDNGIGIDADMLPKVFEMFSQANTAIDRSQGGMGIGLSLAQALVHLHGGSLHAHSDGAGLGSEFTIRLPVLEARPGQALDAQPGEATRVR
ncbi:sensor histidine kinase [Piscinibacter terrae]|uniref:histidine kinase n=1 Tax=Piscinibacter terrae TaxID=2496871 RepID=A0A3N7JTD6_9BURK|nr:GAF domain-containing sensor histidine kinase [Albitalea terrae]RQP22235.1 GAF domain-containing protein [Albitalea terrae]